VREIESHTAESGWDQPARLYALVDTATLVSREPGLAQTLGLARPEEATGLTPVEQELSADQQIEQLLEQIAWPDTVLGCAAVVERLVLPPVADAELPDDAAEAAAYARAHPDRQEVRIVAAATRGGTTYCALRMRAHDDALSVVTGPDLVPGLVELVAATLAPATEAPIAGAAAESSGEGVVEES
jgi:hypothetical protein